MENGFTARGVINWLKDLPEGLPGEVRGWLVIGLIALAVLYFLYRFMRSRGKSEAGEGTEPGIEVATLGDFGPSSVDGPVVEYYNIPARLAAVIAAPSGRRGELPPPGEMHEFYEELIPGLAKVAEAHRPEVLRWPGQLSAEGFAHKVFRKCPLPGDKGKGTPWCAVAGAFRLNDKPTMAGLILRTDRPTSHSQRIIEEPDEGEWIGCLSVRED